MPEDGQHSLAVANVRAAMLGPTVNSQSKISTAEAITVVHRARLSPTAD
jgi:hypothetical protein